MDRRRDGWNYPNIAEGAGRMSIPTYWLYRDDADALALDWIHCETIQARSRLHDYRIEPHRHENLFQILHLTRGGAEMACDGACHLLRAPCLVTVPAMTVHGFTFPNDVEGRVLTLFQARLPALAGSTALQATLGAPRIVPLDQGPAARRLASDIAAVADEFAGRRPERLTAIEARLRLVLIAVGRFLRGEAAAAQAEAGPGLRHVARFRDMVERDYARHAPVEAYARQLGLTAVHLNRVCREATGMSALMLINARLALEARRMLAFTSMSAKEVAFALNFNDPSYFGRFFRRMTGTSPARFRALHNPEAQAWADTPAPDVHADLETIA